MAKRKHWEVPTAFRVHAETEQEAQQLVEGLVDPFMESRGANRAVVVITVHHARRLHGSDDNCPECNGS